MAHSKKDVSAGSVTEKKSNKRHIFLLMALVFICIGTVAYSILSPYPFGLIRDYIKSIDESGIENPSKSAEVSDELDIADINLNSPDVFSFLILGPYDETGAGQLSADKCAILSINSRSSKVSLNTLSPGFCTLMLDKEGRNSIRTEADAEALVRGIDFVLGMQLDGYILLSAEDTVKILDEADGISIKLSEAEKAAVEKALDGDAKISLDADSYARLSGTQALAYLRLDDSIEIAADAENRMQAVLLALKISANDLGLIDTSSLGRLILDVITSDISEKEFTQLFIRSPGLLNFRVIIGTAPLPGSYKLSVSGEPAEISIDDVRLYLYSSIFS